MSGPDSSAAPDRYARQRILPEFGDGAQAALAKAHVVIVGVGALGCTSADLLCRAGVGRLTLIDRDVVEWSNLQRQALYDEEDARRGVPKAEAAAARLARVNSSITITPIVADFTGANAEAILGLPNSSSSLVPGPQSPVPSSVPTCLVDGSDSAQTRHLINDVSVKHAIPYAYAGVVGTRAMQATFTPGGTGLNHGACLRCLFPDVPAPGAMPTCDTAGVLAPAAAIVAAAQAADAIKLAMGRSDLLPRSLLEFDLWANRRRRLDLADARDPSCPCCGMRRFDALAARDHADTQLCGQDAVQVLPPQGTPSARLDLAALAAKWHPLGPVVRTGFMVRVALAEQRVEISAFSDGRAIIKGTRRPDQARALYARFVGA